MKECELIKGGHTFRLLAVTVIRPGANGRNIVNQQFPTLLRPFAHPAACCWMLLRVVEQSL